MDVRRYKPRTVEIEAIQYTGLNDDEVDAFLAGFAFNIAVLTPGDYVLRTPADGYGTCDAHQFGALYEDLGPVE